MPPAATPQIPKSRDKILDVAEACFARSGFGGVGMGPAYWFRHHFVDQAEAHQV